MSSLYQINQQITEAIDLETGEIIDEAAYEDLNIEKEEKLENIALFYKNTMADAEALKAEEKAFAERRKAAENKAVSLKRLLDNELAGSPFVTSRVAIGYRKSTRNHSIRRIIRIIHSPHLFLPIALNLSLFSIKRIILTININISLISLVLRRRTNSITSKRRTSGNNTAKNKRSNMFFGEPH